MQVLQPVHFYGIQVIQSFAGCERAGEGRVVGDALVHRLTADGVGLADGGLTLRRVHDHREFVVLDHVDDVRPPLAYLVGTLAGNARLSDRAGGAIGGGDLEDQDDGKRISYQIVGEDEADIKTGRISITSPIARAIVGKSVGDVVDVVAPGGKHSYEVMVVRYV